ncbi:hypothetical protein HKX48_005852 [Thoreauomyces humboldtii]|nr:hypothetical protein HKX48_005852 [Thoreauomyces humboldtii]
MAEKLLEDPNASFDDLSFLIAAFPDANENYLRNLLRQHHGPQVLAAVSDLIFETGSTYPRRSDKVDLLGVGSSQQNTNKRKKDQVAGERGASRSESGKRRRVNVPEPEVFPLDALISSWSEFECGCCFGIEPLAEAIQCDDAHLFCRECARRAAEAEIGLRRTELKCLSVHGCTHRFSEKQIRAFLPAPVFEGYLKLCQEVEVNTAGLDHLHSCPFCSFQAIIEESPVENPLFFCQHDSCRTVSCRLCRIRNHHPLSCEEAKQEAAQSGKHDVEEAMTDALLRSCPKCSNRFYKVDGCNAMTCTCGTVMCYVCRKKIVKALHYPSAMAGRSEADTCPLFDDTALRNKADVRQAFEEAADAARSKNPDLDVAALDPDETKNLETRSRKVARR